jgi:hypothetical protein
MAISEFTTMEWECDICGHAESKETENRNLPEGWGNVRVSNYTPSTNQEHDACPPCMVKIIAVLRGEI